MGEATAAEHGHSHGFPLKIGSCEEGNGGFCTLRFIIQHHCDALFTGLRQAKRIILSLP